MIAAVECRGASVGYGGHAVVEGIDLRLEPGQWLAVVGTNGSGKSTLLRTIAGLIPCTAGEVRVLGAAAGEPGGPVSYLSQSHEQGFLLPIRARDVVRMGRWPARGLMGAVARRRQ